MRVLRLWEDFCRFLDDSKYVKLATRMTDINSTITMKNDSTFFIDTNQSIECQKNDSFEDGMKNALFMYHNMNDPCKIQDSKIKTVSSKFPYSIQLTA